MTSYNPSVRESISETTESENDSAFGNGNEHHLDDDGQSATNDQQYSDRELEQLAQDTVPSEEVRPRKGQYLRCV